MESGGILKMAVDKTHKLEIQAVYESNNLSVAKVLERFSNSEVSKKTVESWVSKEKWIKNRFVNEKKAMEKLIDDTLPLSDAKSLVLRVLTDKGNDSSDEDGLSSLESNMTPEQLEKYAGVVGKELAYKVLHQNTLQVMMAENLLRSEKYATKANNIGTIATHHGLLLATYKTVHGEIRHINPETGNKIYTDKELEAMTTEQLDSLTLD
ncbi:MAG: hypothetical protein ACI81I_000459 [Arcobacteraceae bacterium]